LFSKEKKGSLAFLKPALGGRFPNTGEELVPQEGTQGRTKNRPRE
jgi:hypothetical protein